MTGRRSTSTGRETSLFALDIIFVLAVVRASRSTTLQLCFAKQHMNACLYNMYCAQHGYKMPFCSIFGVRMNTSSVRPCFQYSYQLRCQDMQYGFVYVAPPKEACCIGLSWRYIFPEDDGIGTPHQAKTVNSTRLIQMDTLEDTPN